MVNVHIDPELPASIPNTSVATRDSIDFRTVHAADLRSGNGDRMTDVECTGTALRDFPAAPTGLDSPRKRSPPDNADAEGVRLFVLQ